MNFYPGGNDTETEPPYGVVMARGFEETVRADGVYYGSIQVRVVHDIDEARTAEQVERVRQVLKALMTLGTPARDAANKITVLGLTPQQANDGMSGNRVFLNVISVEMGVKDDDPDHDETVEFRTEKAFCEYLAEATP